MFVFLTIFYYIISITIVFCLSGGIGSTDVLHSYLLFLRIAKKIIIMNIYQIRVIVALIISIATLSSCKKESATNAPASDTPAVTIPESPSNLQLVSISETAVSLRWKDNSSNENSFVIEQSTDTTNFIAVGSVEANRDSTVIQGTFLTTQTYYFRVKSKNTAGTSEASNIIFRSLFPSPTNLTVLSFSLGSVSMQWSDNSNTETAFIIEQRINGSPYSAVDSTGANITTVTISGNHDSSMTYSFRVVAKNSTSRSGYSNAEARTLGPWVFVNGGSFSMGRNSQYRDERPIHTVTVNSYYISKHEVTVKEYQVYIASTNGTMPAPPAWGWNNDHPMVKVSWNDAHDYCVWLDTTSTISVRLPTEAEWEYAARGGDNSQNFSYSGSNELESVAWNFLNAGGHTHACGSKKPNELGIYDMSGNAWEWCADWQGTYPSIPQNNPKGPFEGLNKIFRGGSWFDYGLYDAECRVETRYAYTPGGRVDDGGFRIVKGI